MTREAMARMGKVATTQIVDYLQRGVLDRDNLANSAVVAKLEHG